MIRSLLAVICALAVVGRADCALPGRENPAAPVGEGRFSLMFWNVENFFPPGQMEGKHWSRGRFRTKCNAVAKTILLAGDAYGRLPDIVAFAEVGDRSVLKALISNTQLYKLDYAIVHYDSPDHRGIDCALLYRRTRFRLESSKPCPLYDSTGAVMPTRDILLAVFGEGEERLAVLVNHHPSKVGAGSETRRKTAMARLHGLVDSLRAEGISRIMAVGDFNEEIPDAEGVSRGDDTPGTIKFQGKWEKIDGCPVLEGLQATEHVFAAPHLTEKDATYGGMKPRRAFSGPRYLAGVSDHYPLYFEVSELFRTFEGYNRNNEKQESNYEKVSSSYNRNSIRRIRTLRL